MTPEIVTAEVGGFLFLGAVLAVSREALKKNWVRFSLSASITPAKDRQAPPEQVAVAATGPVPISEKRGAA